MSNQRADILEWALLKCGVPPMTINDLRPDGTATWQTLATAVLAALDDAGWRLYPHGTALVDTLTRDGAEIARLRKIVEAARPLARRTYVDDVVAHVPYDDVYRLRQALFGSDESIRAGLDALDADSAADSPEGLERG